jgi:hypothetical protein
MAAAGPSRPVVYVNEWNPASLGALESEWEARGLPDQLDVAASDSGATDAGLLPTYAPKIASRCVLLDLCENPLRELVLDGAQWPLLAEVQLGGADLGEEQQTSVSASRVPSLTRLDLTSATMQGLSLDEDEEDEGTAEGGAALSLAAAFPALQSLVLSGCELGDSKLLASLQTGTMLPPSLTEVVLADNDGLSEWSTIEALAKAAPRLCRLDLSGTAVAEIEGGKLKNKCKMLFRSLTHLNGAELASAPIVRTSASTSSGAMDVAFGDKASCSCLEGEPVSAWWSCLKLLTARLCSARTPKTVSTGRTVS